MDSERKPKRIKTVDTSSFLDSTLSNLSHPHPHWNPNFNSNTDNAFVKTAFEFATSTLQQAFDESINGISPEKSTTSATVKEQNRDRNDNTNTSTSPSYMFHYRLPNLTDHPAQNYQRASLYSQHAIRISFPVFQVEHAIDLDSIVFRSFQIAVIANNTCEMLLNGEMQIFSSTTSSMEQTMKSSVDINNNSKTSASTFSIATNFKYPKKLLLSVLTSESTSSFANPFNTMQAGEFFTDIAKQKKILDEHVFHGKPYYQTHDATFPTLNMDKTNGLDNNETTETHCAIWQSNLDLFLLCMFPTTRFRTLPISTYHETIMKQTPDLFSPEMVNSALQSKTTVYKQRFLVKRVILHDDIYKNMLLRFTKDQFKETTMHLLRQEIVSSSYDAANVASSSSSSSTTGINPLSLLDTKISVRNYKDIDWVDRYLTSRYRLFKRQNVRTEWLEDAAWVDDDASANANSAYTVVDLTKRIARIIPIIPESYRIMKYLNSVPVLTEVSQYQSIYTSKEIMLAKRKVIGKAIMPIWARDFLYGRSSSAFINLCNLFAILGMTQFDWDWINPCLSPLLRSVSKLDDLDPEYINARVALHNSSGSSTLRAQQLQQQQRALAMAMLEAKNNISSTQRIATNVNGKMVYTINEKPDSEPVTLLPQEQNYLALLLFMNYLLFQTEPELRKQLAKSSSDSTKNSKYSPHGIAETLSSSSVLTDPSFERYVDTQLAYMPFTPNFANNQSPVVLTLQLDLIDVGNAISSMINAPLESNHAGSEKLELTSLLSNCQLTRIHAQNHQLYSNALMQWYVKDHFFLPKVYVVETSYGSTLTGTRQSLYNKGFQWLTGSRMNNDTYNRNMVSYDGGAATTTTTAATMKKKTSQPQSQPETTEDTNSNSSSSSKRELQLGRIAYIHKFLSVIHLHKVLTIKDLYGRTMSTNEPTHDIVNAYSMTLDTSLLPFPTGTASSMRRNASEYWNVVHPTKPINETGMNASAASGLDWEKAAYLDRMHQLVDLKRDLLESVESESAKSLTEFSPSVSFYVNHEKDIHDFSLKFVKMVSDPELVAFFQSQMKIMQQFLRLVYSDVAIKEAQLAGKKKATEIINAADGTSSTSSSSLLTNPKDKLVFDLTIFSTLEDEKKDDEERNVNNPLERFDVDCIETESREEIRNQFVKLLKSKVPGKLSVPDRTYVDSRQQPKMLSLDHVQMLTESSFQTTSAFTELIDSAAGRNEQEITNLFKIFPVVQSFKEVKSVMETFPEFREDEIFFSVKKWFLLGSLFKLNKQVFGRMNTRAGDSGNKDLIEKKLRDVMQTMFLFRKQLFPSLFGAVGQVSTDMAEKAKLVKKEMLENLQSLLERVVRSALSTESPMVEMQSFLFSLLFLMMLVRGKENFQRFVVEPSNAKMKEYEQMIVSDELKRLEATKAEEELKKKQKEQLALEKEEKQKRKEEKQEEKQKRREAERRQLLLQDRAERRAEAKQEKAVLTKEREEKQKLKEEKQEEKQKRREAERRQLLLQDRADRRAEAKQEKADRKAEAKQEKAEREEKKRLSDEKKKAEKEQKDLETSEKKEKEKLDKLQQEEDEKLPDAQRLQMDYPILGDFLFEDPETNYVYWRTNVFPKYTLRDPNTVKQITADLRGQTPKYFAQFVKYFLVHKCRFTASTKPGSQAALAEESREETVNQFCKSVGQLLETPFRELSTHTFSTSPASSTSSSLSAATLASEMLGYLAGKFMLLNASVSMSTDLSIADNKKFQDVLTNLKKDTMEDTLRKIESVKGYIRIQATLDPWLRMYLLSGARNRVQDVSFDCRAIKKGNAAALNKQFETIIRDFVLVFKKYGYGNDGTTGVGDDQINKIKKVLSNWICAILDYMWKQEDMQEWLVDQIVFIIFLWAVLDPNLVKNKRDVKKLAKEDSIDTPVGAELEGKKIVKMEILESVQESLPKTIPVLLKFFESKYSRMVSTQKSMYAISTMDNVFVNWLRVEPEINNSVTIFKVGNWMAVDTNDQLFVKFETVIDDVESTAEQNREYFESTTRRVRNYLNSCINKINNSNINDPITTIPVNELLVSVLETCLDTVRNKFGLVDNNILETSMFAGAVKKKGSSSSDVETVNAIITHYNTETTAYLSRLKNLRKYLHDVDGTLSGSDFDRLDSMNKKELVKYAVEESALYALSYFHRLMPSYLSTTMNGILRSFGNVEPNPEAYTSNLSSRYEMPARPEIPVAPEDQSKSVLQTVGNMWTQFTSIGSKAKNIYNMTLDTVIGKSYTPEKYQRVVLRLYLFEYTFQIGQQANKRLETTAKMMQSLIRDINSAFLLTDRTQQANAMRTVVALIQDHFVDEFNPKTDKTGDFYVDATTLRPTLKVQLLSLAMILQYIFIKNNNYVT